MNADQLAIVLRRTLGTVVDLSVPSRTGGREPPAVLRCSRSATTCHRLESFAWVDGRTHGDPGAPAPRGHRRIPSSQGLYIRDQQLDNGTSGFGSAVGTSKGSWRFGGTMSRCGPSRQSHRCKSRFHASCGRDRRRTAQRVVLHVVTRSPPWWFRLVSLKVRLQPAGGLPASSTKGARTARAPRSACGRAPLGDAGVSG